LTIKTIGIFADKPEASTGFAVVCRNLANELSSYFRVIYFGRYGQEREFAKETVLPATDMFEYVPCQGGVWNRELCVRILKHYQLDYAFSEDDWFSIEGLLEACKFWGVPFHFLTPIDSLPINPISHRNVFTFCDKVYVPNSGFNAINGKKRLYGSGKVIDRQGELIKAIPLPHGCDPRIFRKKEVDRDKEFTFLLVGRTEERKATGRAVMAYEKIYKKMNARLLIRTDWTAPLGQALLHYVIKKNIPITTDQTIDVPHNQIADVYNKADVNICAAKAGGFEMSITEAALCEVPSLVTDWTFMNENVVHGKSGFKIPVEGFCHPPAVYHPMSLDRLWGNISIDALADKMYWCYLNETQIKSMGRWAKDYVSETFKWKDIAYRLKEEILHEG